VKRLSRLLALALQATTIVDRAYRAFDRLRRVLVTAYASDGVLAAFNDWIYAATPVYDANDAQFREHLFNWEKDAVARVFPPPPSRVLVGGAGGGREPFELARRGYEVTAFEPSAALAGSMATRADANGLPVTPLVGRYEELPVLHEVTTGRAIDLSQEARFGAALLGWASFSHIRERRMRVAALRAMAALTDGPVLVSFYKDSRPRLASGRWERFFERFGRRSKGDAFTIHVGFYHLTSPDEMTVDVADAGLAFVATSYDDSDGHWPWVAVARPEIAATLSPRLPPA
jgi:hypothetical protein